MQGIRVKIADILDFILNLEKPTEPYLSAAHGYVSHPAWPYQILRFFSSCFLLLAPVGGYIPVFFFGIGIFIPTNA